MSKNLIQRLVVAAIFIPAILWISYQGGWWLGGLVLLLATVGMIELLVAEGYKFYKPQFWLILSGTLGLLLLSPGGRAFVRISETISQSDMIVFILLISGMMFGIGKRSPLELTNAHARLIWGVLYIGLLYPFVYSVGEVFANQTQSNLTGGDALLFLFALLWIGDTAAMWVGSTMGKHKLAPSVSPNKTVEGFIGGLVAAALVGLGMAYWKFTEFPVYQILIVAVLCSLFGQLGDLVESMWKRSLGIKDSSAIIPGHGGFLDRFDSLLFAAPVMYYFFVIFR